MECRSMVTTFLVLLVAFACTEGQARKDKASASRDNPEGQSERDDENFRGAVHSTDTRDRTTGHPEVVKRSYSEAAWGRQLYSNAMESVGRNATVDLPLSYKPLMHPVSYAWYGIPYGEQGLEGGTGNRNEYNYGPEGNAQYHHNTDSAYRTGHGFGYGFGNTANGRPVDGYGSIPAAYGRSFGGYNGDTSKVFGAHDYQRPYVNKDYAKYVAEYRAGNDPLPGHYASLDYGNLPLGFTVPSANSWKNRDREILSRSPGSSYASYGPRERASGRTFGRAHGAVSFGSTKFINRQGTPRNSAGRSWFDGQRALYGSGTKLGPATGLQNSQQGTYSYQSSAWH